jgi:hypothetical protein
LPKIDINPAKQKMKMNNLYMGKSSKGQSEQIIRTRDDETSLKQMLSQIEFTKPYQIENEPKKLKRQQDYNSMFINLPTSPGTAAG